MPDETPNTGNLLTRGFAGLREYLANSDLSPGYLGAGAGLLAGSLSTGAIPGEKPVQRAKRILRNALIGGTLGGVGTQALYGGGKTVMGVVRNEVAQHQKAQEGKGGEGGKVEAADGTVLSSYPARVLYALGGSRVPSGVLRALNGGGAADVKAFEQIFGTKGLDRVRLGEAMPPGRGLSSTHGVLANGKTVPYANKGIGLEIADDASDKARVSAVRRMLNNFRGTPTLTDTRFPAASPGDSVPTRGTRAALAHEAQLRGVPIDQARRYLRAQGIRDAGGSSIIAGLRRAETALLNSHSATRAGRIGRRGMSVGGALGGYYAPNFINWMFPGGEAAPSSALPNAGASPPPPPPGVLSKLFAPVDSAGPVDHARAALGVLDTAARATARALTSAPQ